MADDPAPRWGRENARGCLLLHPRRMDHRRGAAALAGAPIRAARVRVFPRFAVATRGRARGNRQRQGRLKRHAEKQEQEKHHAHSLGKTTEPAILIQKFSPSHRRKTRRALGSVRVPDDSPAIPSVNTNPLHLIGLGGGCHWCTEAVFQALRGVERVEQGWIAAPAPDDAFSEAVRVHFDPAVIQLAELIEVHLHTHASRSDHSMRGKYRSAIYAMDELQAAEASACLAALAAGLSPPPVTRVLRFRDFRPSREAITCYYEKDPARAFCRDYIEPKLAVLRQRFPHLLKPGALSPA